MDRILLPDRAELIWLYFRFSGRVSRAAYFLAGLLIQLVPAFLLYRFTLVPQESPQAGAWAFFFWVTLLITVWSSVALAVKRLHDFGRPGLIAAALFVPVVSIIAFIALCLVPGDPGPNRYGPRTNAPA